MPKKDRLSHNASTEEQRRFYEADLKRLGEQTRNDFERVCSGCGSTNPCTGVDTCGQYGESLVDAKRIKSSQRFNPKKY